MDFLKKSNRAYEDSFFYGKKSNILKKHDGWTFCKHKKRAYYKGK